MAREVYGGVVTSKGQVTVPKAVRERLGLKQGDRIEFVSESGHTLVRRARPSANPFAKFAGALDTFKGGKKEINTWLGDLRDDESRPK
jgi:antitoxin PrlF